MNQATLEEIDVTHLLFNDTDSGLALAKELAEPNFSTGQDQNISIQDFGNLNLDVSEILSAVDCVDSSGTAVSDTVTLLQRQLKSGASNVFVRDEGYLNDLTLGDFSSANDNPLVSSCSLPAFNVISSSSVIPSSDPFGFGSLVEGDIFPNETSEMAMVSPTSTSTIEQRQESGRIGMGLTMPPKKAYRKRQISISSESSVTQSTSIIDYSNNEKKPKKKPKLYENPDTSNPKVQRAGYAKRYREKMKEANEELKKELTECKDLLKDAKSEAKKLKEETVRQDKRIKSMEGTMLRKDKKIANLEKALKVEKEKNAFNPEETEEMLRSIQGVVKDLCPKDRNINIIVSEPLANKKCAVLGKDKMKDICADDNLRNRPCTVTFNLKNNQLSATKEMDDSDDED